MRLSGSPIIESTVLRQNTCQETGGAIFISNSGQVTIRDCVFDENISDVSGGAIYMSGSHARLDVTKTTFIRNGKGTIGTFGGNLSFHECFFQDNQGGIGLYLARTTISNCVFINNPPDSEGWAIRGTGSLDYDDGYPDLGRLRVVNSTFYGNGAAGGGAISLINLGTSIQNSIFWGNGPDPATPPN
jgi:predicted outer membrane repeat protein